MMTPRRPHLLAVLFLTLVVVACYANSLGNGFAGDDETMVILNERIVSPATLLRLATEVYGYEYRPLLQFSYFMDYWLWGLNPLGYHLTNLLLHLAASLWVYILLTTLTRRPAAAFIGAILFAAHPAHTEAVNNISSREDPLATVLVLAALCCVVWREQSARRGWLTAAGLGAFTLALFAKEEAAALTLLLPLVDWARGRLAEGRWREQLPLYAGLALITGLYLLLRLWLMPIPVTWPPLGVRLLVLPYATWSHLRLLVAPHNLSAVYILYVPESLTDPRMVFPVAVLAALGLGLFWLWFRGQRLACLGLLWIVAALVPVFNVIPGSGSVAERYLYLPAVGYVLLLGLALTSLRPSVTLGLTAALVLSYGVLTIQRNPVWRDQFTLWQDAVENVPESPLAHNNLGASLELRGDLRLALREYAWAASLAPDYLSPHYNMGRASLAQGHLDRAARAFQAVLRLQPRHAAALAHLGVVSQRQGRPEEAIRLYRAVLAQDPRNAEVWANLGAALGALGQRAEALAALERAVALNPSEAVIHNNLGNLYAEADRVEEAILAYRKALHLNPTLTGTHENLATLYTRLGRQAEAEAHLAEARHLTSGRP